MIEQIGIRHPSFTALSGEALQLKNHLRTRTIFVTMKRITGSQGTQRHTLPGILLNFSQTLAAPRKATRHRTST
ncbi:hypothetical protein [Chlorobaculum tepidum]|uniref:hypothetical protein n=1 Tax=Chlorobaculum tepidum TaxID=1097 RepID=UPI0013E8C2FC|nr:hypothetical protein [Chlorobaculum tepidum]